MSRTKLIVDYIPGQRDYWTDLFVWFYRCICIGGLVFFLWFTDILEWLWLIDPLDVNYWSGILEPCIYRPNDLRKILLPAGESIQLLPVSKHHTHKTSCQYRSSANAFMNDIARNAGYDPFNVSMSRNDYGNGSRNFYFQKDLGIPFKEDLPHENSVFIFTDVDYYANMNGYLKQFRPILMYTLVPTKVQHQGTDFAFSINEKSEVEYSVSGGGSYHHQLWDYKGDVISVQDDDGALCVYNLEQRKIQGDDQHRIIALIPMAKVDSIFWRVLFREDLSLKRKNFLHEGLVYAWEPISDLLSLMAPGSRYSVNLPGKTYEAIRKRLAHKTAPPVIADIERILRDTGDKEYVTNAPILYELMVERPFTANVVDTNSLPTFFQPLGSLAHEDGKPLGRAVTSTLVTNPALFPTRGVNSDEVCISGRVDKVRNNTRPDFKFKKYADEFVKMLVPVAGIGAPTTATSVHLQQDGPQQRARYEQVEATMSTVSPNRLKAFIKAEPYASASDPRNITTVSNEMTILFAAFTNAFTDDVLKKTNWYGPGMSPSKQIQRIRDIVLAARAAVSSDYSRFDGTICKWLSENVTLAAMQRYFQEQYRAEIRTWYNKLYMRGATTENGIKYDAGSGTRSGGPMTGNNNSTINAFISYCTLREMGYNPSDAYAKLGLYTGDDGLNPDFEGVFHEVFETVAKHFGLRLEAVVIPLGCPVPYCGRVFIDPAVRVDSFQDPIRTLGKLHLTANKTVTPEQAATNKALGYLTTDSKTPLIGTWARKVVELTGLKFKGATREEQYKRSNAWPQHDDIAIHETMAELLELTGQELAELDRMIREVTALDQFPAIFNVRLGPKIFAQVGDVVVGPEPQSKLTNKLSQYEQVEPESATTSRSLREVDQREGRSFRHNGRSTSSKAVGIRKEIRSDGNGIPTRRPRRSGKMYSAPRHEPVSRTAGRRESGQGVRRSNPT